MKNRIWLPLFLAFALAVPRCAAEDAPADTPKALPEVAAEDTRPVEDIYADLETFANALTIIDSHYVEEKKPKELVYGALKGLLNSLDPYSQFLDPEAYNEIRVETEGKFGGVGIEITYRDGVLVVISPVDGTPAAVAGVAPGDKIVRIDDKTTRDMSLDDAVKRLRGKPGTHVKLKVLRESEGRLIDFEMTRAIIKVKSIKESRVLANDIGYIRISEFQENTPRDLRTALKQLESQKIHGLILDLRNNPGGLLTVAIEVAEEFVPRGQLIVYTKGRTADQELRFVSQGAEKPKPYPLVLLVNQGSASASEIVSGALKDQKLAVLLGTKTFGKGSVQTVIPMRDGTAIRLTTAKYFTPSGVVIHGVGIQPNIEVPFEPAPADASADKQKKEKLSQMFDKIDSDEEPVASGAPKDLKHPAQSPDQSKDDMQMDNQILRALDLIKALNVYGVKQPDELKKDKTS